MEMYQYLEKLKIIHKEFIDLIDLNQYEESKYQKFQTLLDDQKIGENPDELKSFLHLIVKVSKNHLRKADFFKYFDNLILHFKDEISKYYINSEIHDIFKGNRRILYFLIKLQILSVDYYVEKKRKIPRKLLKSPTEQNDDFDGYERLFLLGENESEISRIIRNDSLDEFIQYVNANQIKLKKTEVGKSEFESNCFLLNNEATLIEYAAFYGSIQIFKYLIQNGAKLREILWSYAIHGRNMEIIFLLEQNGVQKDAKECFKMAVRCHHNEIAQYILSKYINNPKFNTLPFGLKYFNCEYIQLDKIGKSVFHHFCYYDYPIIVDYMLKNETIDINKLKKNDGIYLKCFL